LGPLEKANLNHSILQILLEALCSSQVAILFNKRMCHFLSQEKLLLLIEDGKVMSNRTITCSALVVNTKEKLDPFAQSLSMWVFVSVNMSVLHETGFLTTLKVLEVPLVS
jgi:hypothetical protein